MTFANTALFAISLVPMLINRIYKQGRHALMLQIKEMWKRRRRPGLRRRQQQRQRRTKFMADEDLSPLIIEDEEEEEGEGDPEQARQLAQEEREMGNWNGGHAPRSDARSSRRPVSAHGRLLVAGSSNSDGNGSSTPSLSFNIDSPPAAEEEERDSPDGGSGSGTDGALDLWDTVKLSAEFCSLWFAANYFAAACLEHTTVASATILSSTSSVWTLLFGALIGVERFSTRKLAGVVASLAGIVLISTVDLSGATDARRGSFPHKSARQLAAGDAMAFVSAVLYGFYTVLMKKRIGDETRVDVFLFFGLVGLCNLAFLWPGFFVLHYTGIERFQLPPTGGIWMIVIVGSLSTYPPLLSVITLPPLSLKCRVVRDFFALGFLRHFAVWEERGCVCASLFLV